MGMTRAHVSHGNKLPMPDDLVSMSYREIAAHFGISIDGARMKAHRAAKAGKWRIKPGNHPYDQVAVELPAADLTAKRVPRRTTTPAPRITESPRRDNEHLLTALQSSVALVEQLMAERQDAQAEILRLNQALVAAHVRIIEAKDAHGRDAADLAATTAREIGTKDELQRALDHVEVLKRRLARATRPLWRKALGLPVKTGPYWNVKD